MQSFKMLRAMVGVGIMCALFIVLTFEVTLPIITVNKKEALEKAVFTVLPGTAYKKTFALNNGKLEVVEENVNPEVAVYAGYNQKEEIIGFIVLESKETPGLGDKIEKDENFLKNFEHLDVTLGENNQKLVHPVVAVKSGEKNNPWEVDTITGATITSKAVTNIIANSTAHWLPIIQNQLETIQANNGNSNSSSTT